MKILVTGGVGFIGNHLCRNLIEKGHQVICVDNLSSSIKNNISDLLSNKNFKFLEGDIVSPLFYQTMCKATHIDQIYHLACPASPKYYQADPLKTVQTCVTGTINVLKLAKHFNSTVLLTSTSEIYGEPLKHPQKEDYRGNVNTLGIRACYDESKRLAETLMMEYHRLYNVDVKIVRIFNTYGPKMNPNDGRVVPNFISQCLLNKDITVYGSGSQTRSFCYIDDMLIGLILTMNSDHIGPFNLGNPEEYTIVDLALMIKKLTKSKSNIVYKDLPQDDPTRRCPNIDKAKSLLSWVPKINLESGLGEVIRTI